MQLITYFTNLSNLLIALLSNQMGMALPEWQSFSASAHGVVYVSKNRPEVATRTCPSTFSKADGLTVLPQTPGVRYIGRNNETAWESIRREEKTLRAPKRVPFMGTVRTVGVR